MSVPQATQMTINNRYQIQNLIGRGGMGAVYRAHDRLTNTMIALKQVTAKDNQLSFTSRIIQGDSIDFRLALAQEFKMLATMRHPHIISVLDYGFDNTQQPYFTMELLDEAQSLIEAGREASLSTQYELILQVLHALNYLHRRGVIHRDLKPGNVLVRDNTAQVLDFGLAITHEFVSPEDQVGGTLSYIAPETLQFGHNSPQSDLYAVGVMAYELIAKQHPFEMHDTTAFIQDILLTPPDISQLDVNDNIAAIIAKLLEKQPQNRFSDAGTVIDAMTRATENTVIIETPKLRESFIQAAQFVGRERELAQLTAELRDAKNGNGSSWLIAGESGVGKSRLLDELRTVGLVEGLLVMRGQSVSSGGLPYRQWRDPIRRLSLAQTITDLEAGVLSEVIPDLHTIIDRDITQATQLQGRSQQQRLITTITQLFQRQQQPMMLLLEDLQWASESLKPLQALNSIINTLPLLIVGTYRDDERPNLPDQLPEMNVIHLDRLQPEQIAALSESIIGRKGRNPDVVDLLWRETEGNTFFIVEVIRALAEDAGRLSQIGNRTLPMRVMAGGVQAVLRRRIQRVPYWAMPLLKLAAVYGRTQDYRVLEQVRDDVDLEHWFTACNEVAVLEVHEGRWQFAHDKLREAVFNDLSDQERPALHQKIATAIETVFDDDPTRAVALAEHWFIAQVPEKAAHYASQAGEQALVVGDFDHAQRILENGLSLLDDDLHPASKANVLKHMGALHWRLSDYDASSKHYHHSLRLAKRIKNQPLVADALNGLSFVSALTGYLDDAATQAQEALSIAQAAGDTLNHARALNNLGICAEEKTDFNKARTYYEQALALFESIDERRGMASTLNNLGTATDSLGDYAAARTYYERALALCEEIGYQHGVATLSNNLGLLQEQLKDFEAAWDTYQIALPVSRQIGDRRGIVVALLNMTFIALRLDKIAQARANLQEATTLLENIDQPMLIPHAYAGAAELALYEQNESLAAEMLGVILALKEIDHDFRTIRLEPLQAQIDLKTFIDAIQKGKQYTTDEITALLEKIIDKI